MNNLWIICSIGVVLLVGAAFFVKGNLGSSNRGKRCEYYVHHKPYATVVKSEPDRMKWYFVTKIVVRKNCFSTREKILNSGLKAENLQKF